ncbi:hypothetical protein W97_03577, partial [Coniosporium apollinis CBS 100218]
RLQAYPSTLSASNTLLAAPLPPWLQNPVGKRKEEYDVFREMLHRALNHVRVNEYKPGEGIIPYEDSGACAPLEGPGRQKR